MKRPIQQFYLSHGVFLRLRFVGHRGRVVHGHHEDADGRAGDVALGVGQHGGHRPLHHPAHQVDIRFGSEFKIQYSIRCETLLFFCIAVFHHNEIAIIPLQQSVLVVL